ncbi:PyridoxaL 5'-phosphate dependent protein [Giardia muris]|uniref:PyridoxaL 5'-phosphate dependent protein n=1 Tax=Giardia muris TaxID=5742 RepID=A0A4Z1SXP8_GIAMU|nr:PyridoxaL 5'-phosphate dependent protein [Giardia muris]|eukprot:TNJ30494.1 PyridoxaL 5'-phosphate dependent protein [Giardia muris]
MLIYSAETCTETSQTAKELLLGTDVGAYTTMRTVTRQGIFRLGQHVDRLYSSILAITQPEYISKHKVCISDMTTLQKRLKVEYSKQSLRSQIIIATRCILKHVEGDARIYVRVNPFVAKDHILIFGERLPMLSECGRGIIADGLRNTPSTKDLSWAHERQTLERLLGPGVDEVLLTHDGLVSEGLSSNFFVIRKGVVYTAPVGAVLAGTMRETILKILKTESIPLREETPRLSEYTNWDECFISSTSRGILPFSALEYQGQEHCYDIDLSGKLGKLLLEQLLRDSESIY